MATDAESLVARIRAHADLPLALGFGISTPGQVAEVGRWADAAVVGSALVKLLGPGSGPDPVRRAADFTRSIRTALDA